jgi:hypothetical protein
MKNDNELKMPAPLGSHRIHTPGEVRAHEKAVAEYWAAFHAQERERVEKIEAERAFACRVLTDQEYYELALEREAAQQARQLERDVAALAKEQEKQAFLQTEEPTVQILESTDFQFLTLVEHFIGRGYTFDWDGPRAFIPPSLYHVTMRKTEKKPAKVKA